jgi:GAF domain-containing protein
MKNRFAKENNLSPEKAAIRQLVLFVSLVGFVATAILTFSAFAERNLPETIINGVTAILLAISLITAWNGTVGFGRAILPFSALVSITYLSAIGNGIHDPGILAFAIVTAIAALLLGRIGLIIYGTLSVFAILGIIFTGSLGIFQHQPVAIPDVISALMAMIVSTIILYLNTRQLEQSIEETRRSEQLQIGVNQELLETQESLELQAEELEKTTRQSTLRAEQLRLVAEVAKSIASIQELERLLTTVTNLVNQRFNIYHTGVFLLDENREYAILRAANSAGGQKMLAKGHRLKVGAQGIVGSVTATGIARIALDVELDSMHFNNPDLPDTRSEMALPLRFSGKPIGALDLQSVEANAFTQEDIEVLSILADQVAIAIQNARSLESARNAAQDLEIAYQQITGQAWGKFAKEKQLQGYYFDGVETKSITDASNESTGETLQIPVLLRGQEIGKLKVNSQGADRSWDQDEIAIVQVAAERAALALENARLLEDAQRRASKEQIIGEISSKIGASINLDNILQTTLREMGRILPGAEISIQVENE